MKTRKIMLGVVALWLGLAAAYPAQAEPSTVPVGESGAVRNPLTGHAPAVALPSAAPPLFTRDVKPPDVNSIPVLANLIRAGSKLYYLGQRSGINGWFIVQDGQVQMIYVSADNNTVIVGGMFTRDGNDVTAPQVQELSKVDPEIENLVYGPGGKPSQQTGGDAKANAVAPISMPSTPEAATPAAKAATTSPGEKLMQDLQAAAGVLLGGNDSPQLVMVVDPNCPHCHKTWGELREAVFSNRLQVRLIPIGNITPDSTRAAAQLLAAADPLSVWDKYVAGDRKQLDGLPEPVRVRAINENRDLIEKWNIAATPYLVYRGKEGRIKIVQGSPERMAAVLADLLR